MKATGGILKDKRKVKVTMKNLRVAVFGHGTTNHLAESSSKWAEHFRECIARRKATLYTGGGGGRMLSARRGCVLGGGITVSVNPEIDALLGEDSSKFSGNIIATGQGKLGRVHLLAQSVNIGFAIGGGAGTLTEVIACYLLAKPVIVVDGFQRKYDPKVEKILNNVKEESYNGHLVRCGYLDGKDENKVCPVRICSNTLSPDDVFSIGVEVLKHVGEKKHGMAGF